LLKCSDLGSVHSGRVTNSFSPLKELDRSQNSG
jgi:hypothetical protein